MPVPDAVDDIDDNNVETTIANMITTSELRINTTTDGAQHRQTHVEVDGGHVVCWVSNDHRCICAQKLDDAMNVVGGELVLVDASSTVPSDPDMFRTSAGFGLIYHPNNGHVHVKLFDHEGRPLADDVRVSERSVHVQSDGQKCGVEVDGGYLVMWAGAEDIVARRLDCTLQPLGGAWVVNEVDVAHTKYNPAVIPADEGFLCCWGTRAEDASGATGACIRARHFSPACEALGDEFMVNPDALSASSRYVRIARLHDGGYAVLWRAGYTNVYLRRLTRDFRLVDRTRSLASTNIRSANVSDDEVVVARYAAAQQDVTMQRYDLELNPIDRDPHTINEDPDQEHYDDGAVVCQVSGGGHLVMWNSTKLNDNYEVYARRFIYDRGGGDDNNAVGCTARVVVDNHVRYTEMVAYFTDAMSDVSAMQRVLVRIGEWIQKGLHLSAVVVPLTTQKDALECTLDRCIETFKAAALALNDHAYRIRSKGDENEDDAFEEGAFALLDRVGQVACLCNLYETAHSNICDDMRTLRRVQAELDDYRARGIHMGNAADAVGAQLKGLDAALVNASAHLDSVLNDVRTEKDRIDTDDVEP